ncbi:MAG: questin oxidase family protein, partial [archaeon]|nr:questin oxidase family protein [archaeon]
LGSPEGRLTDFLAAYALDSGYGKLEPVPPLPEDTPAAIDGGHFSSPEEAIAVLQQRFSGLLHRSDRSAIFRPLTCFWEALITRFGPAAVVNSAVPHLLSALFTSAFHPLIHLGLSLKSSCLRTLAEALALAFISPLYIPSTPGSLFVTGITGDCLPAMELSLQEIVGRVREHPWPPIEGAGFHMKNSFLLGDSARMKWLAELVMAWKPAPALGDDLRALEWVSAAAFAGHFDKGCDFFLVHGITSLWALKALLTNLEGDVSLQQALLRHYLFFLLSAYIIQGAPLPATSVPGAPPPPSDLAALLEHARASNDEHIPKLAAALLECAAVASSEERSQFFIDVLKHSLDNLPTPSSYLF